MHILAFPIEVNGTLVGSVAGGLAVVGTALGFLAYKGWSTFKRLTQTAETTKLELEKEALERRQKNEKEEAEIRETLLSRYKEMYELEKERGARDRANIQTDLEDVRKQLLDLRTQYDALRSTHKEVMELNLQLQTGRKDDEVIINKLRAEIKNLTEKKQK